MSFNDLLVRFLIWRLKHISNNNFVLILSGLIGLVAGLAAVTLKSTVHLIQSFLEKNLDITGINYLYLFYPLIGIMLTLLVAKYIFKEKLGHGITQILYTISKNSSIVRRSMMYSRMITSAITVGFGGSVGLEAPIVVTGSAIGSNLGRLTHLNYKKRTLLIACGASGAISAIFNSPIAGVIFAIEVILTDATINKFIPILIASVTGSLVSLVLLGDDILFSFKIKDQFSADDVPYYMLLGIACGIVSVHFTRVTYLVEKWVAKIKNDANRALLGGIGLAIIILIFPPIYGEGYNTIKLLLSGNEADIFQRSLFYSISDNTLVVIVFLFAIVVIKPVASALTLGSGGSGGIFGPSLFIGGISGYLLAFTNNFMLPGQISTSNFTLVGMCGVMSGVLHAPLTAIFLIAEITGGYTLFVPLMLVSAIAFTTVMYFEKHSLYTKNLVESGDLIQHDKDRYVLSLIDIQKVIESDLLTVSADAKLGHLVELVKISKRNIFPVVNEKEELQGIITLDDVRDVMFDEEARQNIEVKSLMQKPPTEVYPYDDMQTVMNKFEVTQAWNLPVIDDGKYLGLVSKSRIFNAYRKKLILQDKE
ncbi:chloride channel protein [Reichenbachiella sp. MALMAid0571]|uniref:chloride channel protein n=1 Tax=Reichenbachiella sp. MALMAid0571 TaxID=3143939 RepID=UPI0032DFBE90